jgi:hypothetical protein
MSVIELNCKLSETASRVCENGVPNWTDKDFHLAWAAEAVEFLVGKGFIRTQPFFWEKPGTNLNAFIDNQELTLGFMVDGEVQKQLPV